MGRKLGRPRLSSWKRTSFFPLLFCGFFFSFFSFSFSGEVKKRTPLACDAGEDNVGTIYFIVHHVAE